MREIAGLEQLAGRHVVLSLSGGKDSTAMGLALQAHGIPFTPVFLDTGWETRWTYDHVRGELADRFGPIVERRATVTLPDDLEVIAQDFEARLGHYSAMVRLCLRKGMFPSRQRRWCTQVLKVFVMRDYLRELLDSGADVVNAVGIRREEGENTASQPGSRAHAPVWSRTQTYGCDTWHPLALWREADVIEAHHEAGLTPNTHYLRGSERVGCLPCIHARKSEIAALGRYHPERVALLADLERVVGDLAEARAVEKGSTLKANGHHRPTWFQSREDNRKEADCPDCTRHVLDDDDCYAFGPDDGPACGRCGGTGRVREATTTRAEMWSIERVVAWSQTNSRGEPFTPESHEEGCMKWGLCVGPQLSLLETP